MAATRALKPQLYPVYREARQSSSAFSVLCHGQPTLDNILFRYDEAGNPVEAKVGHEDTRVNYISNNICASVRELLQRPDRLLHVRPPGLH